MKKLVISACVLCITALAVVLSVNELQANSPLCFPIDCKFSDKVCYFTKVTDGGDVKCLYESMDFSYVDGDNPQVPEI